MRNFVSVLTGLRLTEGDEIFEETINAANKALTRTIVPENTLEILGDPKTQNPEVCQTCYNFSEH